MPSSIRICIFPEITKPRCGVWQLSVPADMRSDSVQRHPGSKIFVGREGELKTLREATDNAMKRTSWPRVRPSSWEG